MTPHYLDDLADFVCNTQWADLPAEVQARGKWVVADCLPVIAAGMQVAEMQALVAAQLAHGSVGQSSVIGTGRRCGPMEAALLNGTAGTWLELDEGNLSATGHPGIQVVPAAVAVAQATGASGAELLTAVVLGYEVSARINRAANVRFCVHPHGTYGVIGAAIAAARLQGLPAPAMREVISMAATMGMATSRNTLLDGATVRNIYTGHAGYMGQMAVSLALSGFTGEVDGVGSIYGGGVLSDRFEVDRLMSGLGSEWIAAQGYFKLHCTGRYVHSAIDALEDALAACDVWPRADDVRSVEVCAYRHAAMLAGQAVTTSFGARFSVPFALATILHHGRSDLHAFSEQAVGDPTVQALASRVSVREEPSYSAAFPERQPCDVVLTLADGNVLAGHCNITKGEPANPHDAAALEAKFFALVQGVWSDALARRVFQGCMQLDEIANISEFTADMAL